MSSPSSTFTGEFHLLRIFWELNVLSFFFVHKWISTHVLSLFFLRSQSLLFTPAAEAWGGSRPYREGCSFAFSIVLEISNINQLFQKSVCLSQEYCTIFQLCYVTHTISQMESVLLSTGLPYASDFASHLNKITHDDHCKYGNSSVAMEI